MPNDDENIEQLEDDVSKTTEPVEESTSNNLEGDVSKTTESVVEESTSNNLESDVSTPPVDSNVDKKKKSTIGIPILILLFICAGVAAYFCFFQNNEEEDLKENEEQKVQTDSTPVYSSYRMSGNSIEDFDLYFLKLENASKNIVYSPLSIKYALQMLSEGSNGETKKQLDDIIGDYKANKYVNNEHMSFANSMFIRDTFKDKVKNEYTTMLAEKYGAELIVDNFSSPDNINAWVKNKTLNLIDNLVDDVSSNQFFLINALAIDMNWNNQIHCAMGSDVPCLENGFYHIDYAHERLSDEKTGNYSATSYPYTYDDEFYGNNYNPHEFNGMQNVKGSDVLADFNRYDIIKELGEDKIRETVRPEYEKWLQTPNGKYGEQDVDKYLNEYIDQIKSNYGKAENNTDFSLYNDEKVKVFAKDLQSYGDTTLQYVGIMPIKDDLNTYVNNVTAKDLENIIQNLKNVEINNFKEGVATRIRGYIPLFKYEYELKLLDDLNKLGIKDVFDSSKADLSNMIDGSGIYINKALHKANIEFSNDGIKAGAATTMGGFGATSGGFDYLFTIPVEEIDISFTKPYMYLIRDKSSGEVWFTGAVYEPIHK